MATLHRFKLFAMPCAAVSGSPARSPAASPVAPLRRLRSLRALLTRGAGDLIRGPSDMPSIIAHTPLPPPAPVEKNEALLRRTLRDLFLSTPPPAVEDDVPEGGEKESARPVVGAGSVELFRTRLLLKRAWWHPTLGTVAE